MLTDESQIAGRLICLAWPAMLSELLIGIALILGLATRYASAATFVYLLIATALAHRYWEYPAGAAVISIITFEERRDDGGSPAVVRDWARSI